MATVREGVMKKEVKDSNYTGKIVDLKADDYTSPEDYVVEVIDRHVEKAKHNLKGSPIVVAGGYGMGSKENFQLLEQLADVLGGEVGAQAARLSTPDGPTMTARSARPVSPCVPSSTLPAVYPARSSISPECRTPLSLSRSTMTPMPRSMR